MDRKPEALATAYRRCAAKIRKIKELGVTPNLTDEQQDKMVEDLALAKAVETNTAVEDHRSGQRWYVEDLMKFSALSAEQQLDTEYNNTFAEQASETEMVDALRELAAA